MTESCKYQNTHVETFHLGHISYTNNKLIYENTDMDR